MSTLKHNIRQQQAQLHNLENTLLRGPRPLPPGTFNSSPLSPEYDQFSPQPSSSSPTKMARRTSYEILSGLAGPDSSIPLPRRDTRSSSFGDENGIKEGIPTSGFGKLRPPSPTRTLSRIPVSSVGNARALAEENSDNGGLNASTSSIPQSASPNRRASFAPGNTTKVLADLQAGVLNAKNALENTKAQLRLSQRQRLRLENEGLNNVVARKERLLQEVLERARKAEAEAVSLKSQLKTETSTSKKTLREMESTLAESQARSQKSEREYITLRESMKGLVESFRRDTDNLREEMRKREEKVRKEAEEIGKKYVRLIEEVKRDRESGESGEVKRLVEENVRVRREIEDAFKSELDEMKEEVKRSSKETEQAQKQAKNTADELSRLRRMIRASVSPSVSSIPVPSSTSSPPQH
ncbi:unnamed protein product [Somion occarium]|uniref:SWI5-dependent HO expression protein 3 n=1 Tax=Somion occarium TaxID=3059160 RepID=A0ABP1E2P5_9APHY